MKQVCQKPAGSEMVTWSLETQPARSQRILKPSTPSQNIKFYSKLPQQQGQRVVRWSGGHSVFGNPATQVPENPKAEHPTPAHSLNLKGYKVGHLVFGNPATQIPVNPKARHPTPVNPLSQMNEPHFDAI